MTYLNPTNARVHLSEFGIVVKPGQEIDFDSTVFKDVYLDSSQFQFLLRKGFLVPAPNGQTKVARLEEPLRQSLPQEILEMKEASREDFNLEIEEVKVEKSIPLSEATKNFKESIKSADQGGSSRKDRIDALKEDEQVQEQSTKSFRDLLKGDEKVSKRKKLVNRVPEEKNPWTKERLSLSESELQKIPTLKLTELAKEVNLSRVLDGEFNREKVIKAFLKQQKKEVERG